MKNLFTSLRQLLVVVTIANLVLAPLSTAAERSLAQVLARDISLQADGSLRGAVTNAAGQPIANRAVTLSRGQEVVASAMTQKDGTFVMKDIRPGVYELATERVASPCRIWAKPAAPPIAHHQALMVESSQIVRGQEMPPVRRALILGGVIVTSGVLGGVIGYNIQDDSAS